MAKYEITAPDGNKYEVTAPDNASEQQILDYAKQNYQASAQQPKEPSLVDEAVSQTVGFVPSLAKGVNRSVGGITQAVMEGMERMGLLNQGRTKGFTDYWNREMMNVPGSSGEQRNAVGEFVGEAAPYMLVNPATNIGRAAVGGLSGLTQYGEGGEVSPEDRLIGGAIGSGIGLVAKPVTDAAIGAGRVAAGGAKSIYNAALGRPDPSAPLHNALAPAMQSRFVTGLGRITNPRSEEEAAKLAPEIGAMKKWASEADEIAKIRGKRPELLLSQQMGSKTAAAAEGAVMKSKAADDAMNELTKMQDDAVSAIQDIGKGFRGAPVSPKRAGAAIFSAHVKWESKLTNDIEKAASENYGKIRAKFGDIPVIKLDNTVSKISGLADDLDDSFNPLAAEALRKRADAMLGERRDFGSIIDLRKRYARIARGQGTIAGLGKEDSSRIASDLVNAINDDIVSAGKRHGNKALEQELIAADTAYREGYDALRKARDSTIGRMVDVKTPTKGVERLNKKARLSADPKVALEQIADNVASMPESQFTSTMNNLRMVDPSIDRRVGRHMIDRALKGAERGGERMETESAWNVTKLYDDLKKSNVFRLIKDKDRAAEADLFMRWLARTADRSGVSGSATSPVTQATQAAMAGTTMSAPFVVQAMMKVGLAPALERALFTEGGRNAMKTIMKYPNVNPAVYEKAVEYMTRGESFAE